MQSIGEDVPTADERLKSTLCGHSLRSAARAYDAPLRHSFDAYFGRLIGSPRYLSRVLCAEDERRNDTMDIGSWLRGLGLERYEQAFRENEIDEEVLPGLTADDLKDLGVALVGHRRRLLDAIAALATAPPAAVASAREERSAAVSAEAERRQVTVMFCDLVGSTPLSALLDPEDLRGIIGAYQRCVAEIVEGFGGFVARYMGDGVLAYFGYPHTHEDDAERATRCGLAPVDRVPQLNQAEELHARVGIATGLVVVGGEVDEHDVAGETPNLAARLQALLRACRPWPSQILSWSPRAPAG